MYIETYLEVAGHSDSLKYYVKLRLVNDCSETILILFHYGILIIHPFIFFSDELRIKNTWIRILTLSPAELTINLFLQTTACRHLHVHLFLGPVMKVLKQLKCQHCHQLAQVPQSRLPQP